MMFKEYLERKISNRIINECTAPGDNTEACVKWIEKQSLWDCVGKPGAMREMLEYLEEIGYDQEELREETQSEVLIKYFWNICHDIKDREDI